MAIEVDVTDINMAVVRSMQIVNLEVLMWRELIFSSFTRLGWLCCGECLGLRLFAEMLGSLLLEFLCECVPVLIAWHARRSDTAGRRAW